QPEILMEALFKNCDLETRFNMNMNVLEGGLVPKVMNIKEALQNWMDHQQEVLVRRSQFRLEKVLHRLEVLEGYLVVYLNIDEVIRIIRFEDEPKQKLIETFKLTDVQAEAILNLRLRRLHKLEEMEIRTEHDGLTKEKEDLEKLIKSEARQWTKIKKQIGNIKKMFGPDTALGARRTMIGSALEPMEVDLNQVMIEKEPVTVVYSSKGWIKAMKGHGHKPADIKYKDGDRGAYFIEAQTTDKIIILATNGRFYTLGCDKLPSGRGFGEPLRLMVDIPNNSAVADMQIYRADKKMLVYSNEGRGFIVSSNDVLAQTKTGKQILNVSGKSEAVGCYYLEEGDDHVAIIGKNRKMLVFPINELPEMSKGKGVMLQKYKDSSLSDLKTFNLEKGLEYKYGAGTTTVEDIAPWIGKRASAGRLPPNGFPKSNRFGYKF
ncbi:MAG: DNA topoisomerase IV subunit A, partial [Alphaproteobacteria bacterium]|nr:DNA topoisomerase IV subunit A [Alphaproteobacteria bacterium]